jgi:hypothetical protein
MRDKNMSKFGKELIESMLQAARQAAGQKVRGIRHRRGFATAELSDERAEAIAASRMDERHAHLDALLEPK